MDGDLKIENVNLLYKSLLKFISTSFKDCDKMLHKLGFDTLTN